MIKVSWSSILRTILTNAVHLSSIICLNFKPKSGSMLILLNILINLSKYRVHITNKFKNDYFCPLDGVFSTYIHWGSGNCSRDAETVYAGNTFRGFENDSFHFVYTHITTEHISLVKISLSSNQNMHFTKFSNLTIFEIKISKPPIEES